MSINVKKITQPYYEEDGTKILYVNPEAVFENAYAHQFISEEKYKTLSNYYKKFLIPDTENVANNVSFFNTTPLKRKSSRVYFVLFNELLYEVSISSNESEYSIEELSFFIKEKIYKENKKFEQIKKQVELYEKFETQQKPERREPIPEDVKFEVWRRDGGKCVICGSQKNLEFDHIIPFSKGGSSTARNLQLLCQDCNRHKSDKI